MAKKELLLIIKTAAILWFLAPYLLSSIGLILGSWSAVDRGIAENYGISYRSLAFVLAGIFLILGVPTLVICSAIATNKRWGWIVGYLLSMGVLLLTLPYSGDSKTLIVVWALTSASISVLGVMILNKQLRKGK